MSGLVRTGWLGTVLGVRASESAQWPSSGRAPRDLRIRPLDGL